MSLYEKLKSGQTVHVYAALSGTTFDIQPVYWGSIVLGYTVLVDGKPVPGNIGMMLADWEVRDWVSNLIEVEK